jgi:hypothetical protein
MQAHLKSFEAIGAVLVTRSVADEQGGYLGNRTCVLCLMTIPGTFEWIVVHGDGLVTTNSVGGALVENARGVDGSFLSETFTLMFHKCHG